MNLKLKHLTTLKKRCQISDQGITTWLFLISKCQVWMALNYREIQKIDRKANVCFLTASELYYEEFREKEYNAINKDLFIRKRIENEELVSEIDRLIKNKVDT